MRRVFGASEGLRQNLLGPTSEVPQLPQNNTRKAEFTRRTRQQQQQIEQRNIQPASVEIPTILGNKNAEGSSPINISSNKNDIVAWDMCLVVPNPNFTELTDSKPKSVELCHEEIIERLLIGGLLTYQYYTGDNDEIIIKIGCPLSRLRKRAEEEAGITFLLNEKYLEEQVDIKNPIGNDPSITSLLPYQYIYDKYKDGNNILKVVG
eukprot:gene38120-51481_t